MNRYLLYTLVFLASASLMVVEIIASRIIAPYVGMSIYTWTSVIGVILLGIALGNWIGGKVADKYPKTKTLGVSFLLSSLSTLSILLITPLVWSDTPAIASIPFPAVVLLLTFISFFPVAFFLSFITPLAIRFQLHDMEKTGRTVGTTYGFSAAGSILGTFLTGFWLTASFGTQKILWAVFLILLIPGSYFFFKRGNNLRRQVVFMTVVIILGAFAPLVFSQDSNCQYETRYYCINILEDSENGESIYHLVLDDLLHSTIYSSQEHDPFGVNSMRALGMMVGQRFSPADEFKILFLGGGGYVLPRYFLSNFPLADVTVIEIDPKITQINRERFGLKDSDNLNIIHGDARYVMNQFSDDEKFDVVIADTFNDYIVPFQLTTKEFDELLKKHLSESGIYLFHFVDNPKYGRFLSSNLMTVSSVFPNVYFLPLNVDWEVSGTRLSLVIAGSLDEIDIQDWVLNTSPIEDSHWELFSKEMRDSFKTVITFQEMKEYVQEHRGIVLTDDYNPVENMLAPLFVEQQ